LTCFCCDFSAARTFFGFTGGLSLTKSESVGFRGVTWDGDPILDLSTAGRFSLDFDIGFGL
jgi:hypothetical protein